MPSVAMTAAEYMKCESCTAARMTKFFTQFWNANRTSTLSPALVRPPSALPVGASAFTNCSISCEPSRSIDRFSGRDIVRWAASLSASARLALPGEATRADVVLPRARVVADGLHVFSCDLDGRLQPLGWRPPRRGAATSGASTAGLQAVRRATRGCNR